MPSVAVTAIISIGTAIIVAIATSVVTYLLTKRRVHEADWRKLKLGQYQEFVLALSGNAEGRSSPSTQARYSDAINNMLLVAPPKVLRAMRAFQKETSYINKNRSDERHDKLLNDLFLALREDVQPGPQQAALDFRFWLTSVPPTPPTIQA